MAVSTEMARWPCTIWWMCQHANGGDADVLRQAILGQAKRLHEVFEQHFAGVDGGDNIIKSPYFTNQVENVIIMKK